jgi:hypothetical protein
MAQSAAPQRGRKNVRTSSELSPCPHHSPIISRLTKH